MQRLHLLLVALGLSCVLIAQSAHGEHRQKALGWGSLPTLASAAAIATVADIALSRHCVAVSPGCREANPLLPRNAAATWAIEGSFTAGMAWLAHRLQRRHSRLWPVPLAALIAAHALGTTSAALTLRQRR